MWPHFPPAKGVSGSIPFFIVSGHLKQGQCSEFDLPNLVRGQETNPHPSTESDNTEEATPAMNAMTNTNARELLSNGADAILSFPWSSRPYIETIETAILHGRVQAMEDIIRLDTDLRAM
jgi:hypothetical protein